MIFISQIHKEKNCRLVSRYAIEIFTRRCVIKSIFCFIFKAKF